MNSKSTIYKWIAILIEIVMILIVCVTKYIKLSEEILRKLNSLGSLTGGLLSGLGASNPLSSVHQNLSKGLSLPKLCDLLNKLRSYEDWVKLLSNSKEYHVSIAYYFYLLFMVLVILSAAIGIVLAVFDKNLLGIPAIFSAVLFAVTCYATFSVNKAMNEYIHIHQGVKFTMHGVLMIILPIVAHILFSIYLKSQRTSKGKRPTSPKRPKAKNMNRRER
ncbi:hypothetical protein P261_00359 [Lachnospiraceae bacterium TWA4]|nr:hypothetical protein P261_00359 [Lachnospiraceae bacterium TWA4]